MASLENQKKKSRSKVAAKSLFSFAVAFKHWLKSIRTRQNPFTLSTHLPKTYKYRPLPHKQESFRLLELLPGNGDDPIHCRLRTESINDPPPYEAISYVWTVWDDTRDKVNIFCHGRCVTIPWNLRNALQRLRKNESVRPLWADAVCINQEDIEERGHQVQVMGPIFSRATKVLVWLGRGSEFDADAAFELIRSLAPISPNFDETIPAERLRYFQNHAENLPPKQWEAFAELLNYRWFKRVWVLQEIGLASYGLLLCGQNQVPWTDFAATCRTIHSTCKKLRSMYRLRVVRVAQIGLLGFKDYDQGRIETLLHMARSYECSDPLDYVYGLFGHVAFERACRKAGTDSFVPIDYAASHPELYHTVAAKVLERPGRSEPLLILSFVQHTNATINDTKNIVSWAPQWNTSCDCQTIDTLKHRFTASMTMSPKLSLHGCALQIQGICFDAVEWRSEAITRRKLESPVFGSQRAKSHIMKSVFEELMSKYSTRWPAEDGVVVFSKLCRTVNSGSRLSSGHDSRREVSMEERVADLLAYFDQLGIVAPSREHIRDQYGEGDCFRFLETTSSVCRSRRLFITEKGFSGLGPGVMQAGDKICVFFGGHVPFVIRPQAPGEYRLCGECYVDGIMNGEAINMWKRGELEEETFTLT